MQRIVAACVFGLAMAATIGDAVAQNYQVVRRFHQPAAPNREEADITIIRCANGRQYYIYGYYRAQGPHYRAIIPPYWGNALGGRDHFTFEQAIAAACTA
jgi:hypothetical protein